MIRLFPVLRTSASALLSASLLSAVPLHAEVLGFDTVSIGANPASGEYAAASIQGQSPDVDGFTGPWVNASVSATATGLTSPAPNYLGATGGALHHTANGRAYRTMDTPLVSAFAADGTVYWSFLAKFGTAADNSPWSGYAAVEVGSNAANDTGKALAIGVQDPVVPGNFLFQINNGAKVSLGTLSDTGTHLFLVRFNLSTTAASDAVTIWVDPDLSGGLASDPGGGVTVSSLNFFSINNLRFAGGANSFVDEIRFGTTLGSVIAGMELPLAPVFISQPEDHSGFVGKPVILSGSAPADPAPSYQWERSANGTNGWTAIPGATGHIHEIGAAPYAANGFYRLTATNVNGSVSSDVVQVSLAFPPPQITEQPEPVGSEPGGDATFTVVATGLGNLTYQWRKNGEDLPGKTSASIDLTGLTSADLGTYSVRIVDDAATAEALPATSIISDAALLIFGDLGGYQTGLTYRLYDIREPMDQLYPLVPGQTPNVDEKRDTVDWSGSADFSSYSSEFIVEVIADLFVPDTGNHEFRLTSSDGSELWIGNTLVVDHDGEHVVTSTGGSAPLTGGLHPLRVRFFLNTGTPVLKIEWRPEGTGAFSVVPEEHLLTPSFVTRVVAPGKKNIIKPGDGTRPGSGAPLVSAHPEWEVHTIRPAAFNPKVGALAVHPDGRLFVATFEPNKDQSTSQPATPEGRIWALTNTDGDDPEAVGVTEVANGLFEPAGMTFVGNTLYVSQRLEVTRLLDNNGDGFYETHETVGSGWESNNYHMFNFGLIEHGGFAYSTLSTSIIFAYTGFNGPNPANRGTLVRTNLATGVVDYLAGGLRTPNGVGFGPGGDIFQTDNQGAWLPSSRLNHLREGHFYGHYNNTANGGLPSLHSDKPPTPPAVWLPQNEISNSPTQPILIPDGHDFAGDMLVGELTLGGINRVSLEKVKGEWQGAVYRFSQGFEGGVNRIQWAPDGSLYVGCIGAGTGNWSWNGTTRGLQRLSPKPGAGTTFEIDRVEATSDGFRIKYTKPVPAATLNNPASFGVKQWTYSPSENYGGSKVDETVLTVSSSVAAADRRSVALTIPGLKKGYVVHLKSDVLSDSGEAVWSSEAWYTLNSIPGGPFGVELDSAKVSENEPAGTLVGRLAAEHDIAEEPIVFTLPAGQGDNGRFAIIDNELVTTVPFDYERRTFCQVRVRATDSSGKFTDAEFAIQVTDLTDESPPHRILLTNAVLPPDHSAGAVVGSLLIDDADIGDLAAFSPSVGEELPILYEGFAYTAGSTLTGLSGGSGFGGAWVGAGSSAVATTSLAYTDANSRTLTTSGNCGVAAPSSRNHRPLAATRGANGTVSYVSFLADPGDNVHFWGVEFWNGTAADANRVLQIGNQNGFGVRVRNNTNKLFAAADDASHFFVVKIDHLAGNDSVSVWIDPPLAPEPTAPDLFFSTVETGGSINFTRIGFSDFVATSAPAVDELRLGNDWSSVMPHQSDLPHFELVSGLGDTGNDSFSIRGDLLVATALLSAGLHPIRVRVTDSAGLAFEQVVRVWVGSGHVDSNGDGITDATAVRLGFDPVAPMAPGTYFGESGTSAVFEAGSDSFLISIGAWPGNLYWIERSPDLVQWTLEKGSVATPATFLAAWNEWQLPRPMKTRYFWRVGGGWPDHGSDPLANGLSALTFVGGSAGWTYDSNTGILRQDHSEPSAWAHFGATYSDFFLSLDYRLSSNGNAGVFLRCAEAGDPWITGSEIQLTNEPRLPVHSTGAVYDRLPASPAADARHSVWHHLEVLMTGDRLRVLIDGVPTVDVADVREAYPAFAWPASGLIGLQDSHSTADGTVEYRNIRLVSLIP